jgi:hypothetical protein
MSANTKRRPLQIYLDSSDYSLLSDSNKRTAQLSEIERRLIEYRDRGVIEIRFSYAHIAEVAPISVQHLQFAKARFACIARLCQQRVLIAPSSLIEDEIRHICNGTRASPELSPYRDDGNWTPNLSEDDFDFQTPAAAIKRELEIASLGRAARRKLERQYFTPTGALRPAALLHLKQTLPATLAEIREKYPLSPTALEAAKRYCTGYGTSAEIGAALMQSFSDLTTLADWFEQHWEKVTPVTTWLRVSGENLKDSLLSVVSQIERMYADAQGSLLTAEQITMIGNRTFEEMHSQLFANIINRIANHIGVKPPNVLPQESWRVAPGLFTAVEAMVAVGKASALAPMNPRVPKRSDVGDVLHCLYIPFVDIFRADAFMANAIRSASIPTVSRICSNLLNLIHDIEELSGA